MICNLTPEKFQKFGIIVPGKDNMIRRLNNHSIVLTHRETWEYQAGTETWIAAEEGDTILSVSSDGVFFQDFYLDYPVILKDGIYFTLTAFRKNATVRMAGSLLPRLLESRQTPDRFPVRPTLQVKGIYTLFYQQLPAGFHSPDTVLPVTELIYTDRGKLHSVSGEKDLELTGGDMILYGPDQEHRQYADPDETPEIITLIFDAEGLPIEQMAGRKIASSGEMAEILHKMLEEQEKMDSQSSDMLLALLTQLLLLGQRANRVTENEIPNRLGTENEIIQKAAGFVGSHIRENLSVAAVAQETKVSISYLTALFQKYLQIAPGEYIRRMKLQEGKQLIRQGNMNFTEIAEALHYSTVNQFSRQFKEKYQMTPTEYARSVRE